MHESIAMTSKPIALLVASLALFAARGDTAPASYGHMHMKYERTFLGVDVANVDVFFDDATSDRFRQLAAGKQYSDEAAERVARTALEADDVRVQVQLLRNAPLEEFLSAARKNLERARAAGYISQETFATAWNNVQKSFAQLAERGFKKGDRLLYHARPGSLDTTVMDANNHVLLAVSTPDATARRAMLASYFAPGTDFRKGLVADVFQ